MEDIIGIMGAMPEEVDQLCALLDGVSLEPYAGVEYHQGYLGERPGGGVLRRHGQGQRRRHRAGAHYKIRRGAHRFFPAWPAT